MKMRIDTSRLLIAFFVTAAFLFGQATALEHVAKFGDQIHKIADHQAKSADAQEKDKGDDGSLCDLSVYAQATPLAHFAPIDASVTLSLFGYQHVVIATQLLDVVTATGPPVRGPPHLS